LARGKAAVILQQTKTDPDVLTLDVGNIMPGQKVIIRIELFTSLTSDQGFF
jgi:hypothetical protein